MAEQHQTAIFGGGCFWCTEAVYAHLKGVIKVVPGYAGGQVKNPTYQQVCGGNTGHAEVIRIEFDPAQISFKDLLTVFFATHDPTTPNQQGHDVGTQYRSIILYATEAQKREAEAFVKVLGESGEFKRPIVTEIRPLAEFYEAEPYHHAYFSRNGSQPYCQIVIVPKLEKLGQRFRQLLAK